MSVQQAQAWPQDGTTDTTTQAATAIRIAVLRLRRMSVSLGMQYLAFPG